MAMVLQRIMPRPHRDAEAGIGHDFREKNILAGRNGLGKDLKAAVTSGSTGPIGRVGDAAAWMAFHFFRQPGASP